MSEDFSAFPRAARIEIGARDNELKAADEMLKRLWADLDAAKAALGVVVDALYDAHDFIETVTTWDGQQDDQEETLQAISATLKELSE